MVGSADYWNEDIDGNVNMVFRNRLAGSAFKPVVYAAGFLKGYSPATILFDLETDFGNDYIPQNYDGTFYGPTSVRKALAHSRNIPAVKMAFLAGVDNVVNLGKSMGFTDLIDADQYGTSIGLGTAEVTLYQMVTAYSTFARGGNKIAFTPFLRIETSDGKIIENNENRVPREQRVLDPQIAYTVNHILSDPAARPSTWTRLQIPNQINAVKTGTSNKRVKTPGIPEGVIKPMDNWIIGYTTRIASGVWVGNNDATPLKPISDGLTTAGRIWHDFMAEATKENDLEEFPKPKGITWKKVSRWSGLLPSPHTPPKDTIVELFTTFNTPEEVDQTFLSVEIDEVSRKLPTEFTPVESIVKALVANFRSENPTDPNWERPVQAWARNFIDTTAKDYVILAAIPTEYDNIHTQSSSQQKSSIHITSPTDGGEIMAGGTIDVQVRIDAPHGTKKVEYSLSGRLADTAIVPPFTGKLRIRTHKIGQLFSIEAKLTDQYGYQTSDSIEVVTAELTDTENPVVQITYPQEGAIFPANTTITVRAEARDNVSVAELLFFLDDREIERISTSPFHLSLTLPDEIAPHAIRVFAKDTSGNTASDEVAITIEEPDESGDIPTQFIFPKEAASFTVGSPIDLFFQISPEELKDAMEITVKAKELASGRMDIIFRVKDAKITQHYSSTWWPGIAGDYELSIQTIGASGIPRESEKLNLKLK
ncbi:MAG: Ig-like domain-containing protein, partial [bacterium]|nr:Ig-like domain-containing protein [bacterium]